MVSTIDEARTPAELAEWLRVWADGYEEGVDYLDDNDARQLAEAVKRVCAPCNAAALGEDAVNERDRLRDIVKRMADKLEVHRGIFTASGVWSETGCTETCSLIREARSAIGEETK